MRPSVIRFLILLALSLGLSAVPAPAAHATVVSGEWQVLGAAASLPTLYRPAGLAVDAQGNVYVVDAGNFRVVEIGPSGRLKAHFGEADLRPGPGVSPPPNGGELMGPLSLAVDAHGTVYVADSSNGYIRVFSPHHYLVDDWPISVPGASVIQMAVAVGARGNVIVAIAARVVCSVPDGPGYCATYVVVQRRSPEGAVLGQFHTPIGPSGMDIAPPAISQIATAVDSGGEIYVATSGVLACYKSCPSFHYLTKYRSDGKVLRQWGSRNLDVSANWPAIAVGGRGNVFVADDFNHRVEKHAPGGQTMSRWSLSSLFPRLLAGPSGITVGRNGAIYVSDPGSGRILTLSSSGTVVAQWGTGGSQAGRFWSPGSLALDAKGRLWVDDAGNSRLQMLGPDGRFHVQFPVPHAGPAMTLDRQDHILIGQIIRHKVYISSFTSSGKLLAQWGGLHLADVPSGIAVGPNGDVFVSGYFFFGNDRTQLGMDGTDILRLSPNGRRLSLVHVTSGLTGSSIAVDAQENTYIAFGTTPRFEKRSRDGTLLVTWGVTKPEFYWPSPASITLDATGSIYVANTPQSFIEKFTPNGIPLGGWGFHGSYPGQFHHPAGIAVTLNGTMYVADTDNNRIQKLPR